MLRTWIDLNGFERNSEFYGSLDLLATVKNFDLQSIRARYLASKANRNARTGSVERRAPAMGGLVSFRLSGGQILNTRTLVEMREPRGIASKGDRLAFSSENKVYLLEGSSCRLIGDPWFSYIHTVDFSPADDRLLVSSSGFDLILEYELDTLQRSREWWAWENGFDIGTDPVTGGSVRLSRKAITSEIPLKVIRDPQSDSLPTAMRAAFINSVEYDPMDTDRFIATFFHSGAIYSIDARTGKAEKLLDGLRNPHGGMRLAAGYMATSTRSGEVIVKDADGEYAYAFENLPGKPENLGKEEWIQNSKRLDDGSILSIDSNRTSWVIFHPEKALIDIIPYPDHLAVQDMVCFPTGTIDQWTAGIQSIHDPANGLKGLG